MRNAGLGGGGDADDAGARVSIAPLRPDGPAL